MNLKILEELRLDRYQIIEELQNKYLPFTLGTEQIEALIKILEFIDDLKATQLTLSGSAGVGKSACVKIIIEYLERKDIRYLLAAPTHKASNVLSQFTGRDSITLHRLLELKPSLDILLLDYKDLKYTSNACASGIPYKGIVIIDECSMINDVLYDFIVEKAAEQKAKIIFVGDIKQCAPVKDNHISKSFQVGIQICLTQIYRQKEENPILEILQELRYKSKPKFDTIISEHGCIVVYNNWKRFLHNTKKLFEKALINQNPNEVKLIAYTNKRIETFNNLIRTTLFDNDDEYHIGEFLTGYDTTLCKFDMLSPGYNIINSEDYVITDIQESGKLLGQTYFKGFNLTLRACDADNELGQVFIISKNESTAKFKQLATELEAIRMTAVQTKNKKSANMYWRSYFKLMESFLTPYDLIYEDRIVRKKSIDYGYCISVHKSQGSSLDNVLIDMSNILLCRNKEDLRQLQYVAMSRTKNNIVILN